MDWREKEQLKQWYRDQGVPVGVGMPEGVRVPEEEVDRIQQEMDEAYAQQKAEQDMMYGDQGGGYTPHYVDSEKAKIIDYINTVLPAEYDEKKRVKAGEVPPEIMFTGALYSIFAHNSTMSNLDENEIRTAQNKLKTGINVSIGAMEKGRFTPDMMAKMEGAELMGLLRINQNKNGQERYFSGVEASDQHHSYSTGQRASILENIKRAFKK